MRRSRTTMAMPWEVLKGLVLALTIVLGGCVVNQPSEPEKVEPVQVVSKPSGFTESQLKQQVSELRNEVAKLELKLLEKQAEINQLQLSQQNAIREAVRTKAKLRSRSSKAEAVANMVETKMALKAIKVEQINEQEKRILKQANALIEMSDKALDEGNIDGASFLSSEARQLILNINLQKSSYDQADKGMAKIIFLTPLNMKTIKKSNVRVSPDLEGRILYKLERGQQVKALAHTDKWIHIEDSRRRKGWIYYQLLKNVQ